MAGTPAGHRHSNARAEVALDHVTACVDWNGSERCRDRGDAWCDWCLAAHAVERLRSALPAAPPDWAPDDADIGRVNYDHGVTAGQLRAALKKDDPVAKAKTSDGSVSQQAVTGGDLSVASVTSATPNDSARRTAEAVRLQATAAGSPTLNDFHAANWRRQHEAFAPAHSLTELVVCVQEEVGELAAAVLGVTGAKKRKAHLTNADVLDAVADAMTYLSLVASAAGCDDLETLLYATFDMVSARAGSDIKLKGGG